MTERTITAKDIERFVQLKSTIETATTELDALKADFRDSFPIGDKFESGSWYIQVRRSAPTFDSGAFEKTYPEAKNPRLYKTVPDRSVITKILTEEERAPFFTETTGAVMVTPKKK